MGSGPGRGRARWPWLVSLLTLGADQLTKHLLVGAFVPGESIPLLHPVIYLTYVQNTGAAFGLFKGQQMLFVGLTLLIITWIGWELLTQPAMAPIASWSSALILGGAIGNLMDRVRLGYVIDFLDLRVWPVFNVGDSAITIGVTLLIWHSLLGVGGKGQGARGRGNQHG